MSSVRSLCLRAIGVSSTAFRWRQQFRRAYPEEFLKKSDARGKGDYHIDFEPAPRITEADKTNDKRYQHNFPSIFRQDQFLLKEYYRLESNQIEFGGDCEPHIIAISVQALLSLKRALDRRLYLLIYGDAYGTPKGQPVWHLPEKVYNSEETLRKCAEAALQSVIEDLSNTYFVGNAPMGHIATKPTEKNEGISSFTERILDKERYKSLDT
ncbi:39S ribosomal protein L46, mitochondrial [Tanacetum coccineum]